MFASQYQGGPALEVFTTKGKNPLEKCKVFGGSKAVARGYDRECKGYIYDITGNQTKLQLPADDRKHTLRLQQPFLVLQVRVPLGKSMGIDLGFHDAYGTRRRILLSTAFKETKRTPLHTRVPLEIPMRGEWINLCIDLQDMVSNNFDGQVYQSLDFISVSAWCSLRKIFTLRQAPPVPEEVDHFPGRTEPIPPALDLEGALVQMVRMRAVEAALEAAAQPKRPSSAAARSAKHRGPVAPKPLMRRPTTAPTPRQQTPVSAPRVRGCPPKPRAQGVLGTPAGARAEVPAGGVSVRAHRPVPGEPSAWCDGAGDIGSPSGSVELLREEVVEEEFVRQSLKERRRHVEALRVSIEEEDIRIAAMGATQSSGRGPARRAPPTRSARQVWAEAPHGAGAHLMWSHGSGHSSPKGDYSSRYEPEPSPEPVAPIQHNPWALRGLQAEVEIEVGACSPAADHAPVWPSQQSPENPPQTPPKQSPMWTTRGIPAVRESALLADALHVYGEENRFSPGAVASPSPAQHLRGSRSVSDIEGDQEEEEEELLWLSHSPESEPEGDVCSSPQGAGAGGSPGWLARPPPLSTNDPLNGTLGGTLFRPSDSPSPSSLSHDMFAQLSPPQRPYEPEVYSAEKEPLGVNRSLEGYTWSSGGVYDDCLSPGAVAPSPQEVVVGEGGAKEEEDMELELLYDPALNCYFDPKTNQYYELRDD
eukprot:TRINITY_DN16530_c0_g1_i4.p1 TRINITY_DN16530_c0_g1~~TRINITY_DN16530_c0_g1_i4.p1  ORF type:complete len:703 (-),score=121.60 TRINITY_DN16530_c0_g1_i4:429-2537(-)